MKKVVTNSTVLILLSKINKLDLLDVFQEIYTTLRIKEEVLNIKKISEHERSYIEQFFDKKIKIINPNKELKLDLGVGETSAISLCKEKEIPILLSDDKKARRTAELLQIKSIGTLGIILLNLKNKKINKQKAREILDLLIYNSYYISSDVYAKMLKLIDKNNKLS